MGVSGGLVPITPAPGGWRGPAGSRQQEEAVPVPMAVLHLQGGSSRVTALRLRGGDGQDPKMELGDLCSSKGVSIPGMYGGDPQTPGPMSEALCSSRDVPAAGGDPQPTVPGAEASRGARANGCRWRAGSWQHPRP